MDDPLQPFTAVRRWLELAEQAGDPMDVIRYLTGAQDALTFVLKKTLAEHLLNDAFASSPPPP